MGFTPGRSKRQTMSLLHSIQTGSDNQPVLFPMGVNLPVRSWPLTST